MLVSYVGLKDSAFRLKYKSTATKVPNHELTYIILQSKSSFRNERFALNLQCPPFESFGKPCLGTVVFNAVSLVLLERKKNTTVRFSRNPRTQQSGANGVNVVQPAEGVGSRRGHGAKSSRAGTYQNLILLRT